MGDRWGYASKGWLENQPFLLPSSLSATVEADRPPLSCPAMMQCLVTGPKATGPSDLALEPRAKISLSSLRVGLLGILSH